MSYFGGGNSTVDRHGYGFPLRVGMALSGDGLHWIRLDGPYAGAVLDVGEPGSFDHNLVAWPHVVNVGTDGWRMYYHSVDPEGMYRVGLAVSTDGLRWQRYGEVMGPSSPGRFDELGVSTRQVLYLDGSERNGAILSQAPAGSGRWDHRIGCPWIVPMDDGSLRMYYIGSNERPVGRGADSLVAVHQIGLAVSDGDIT